MPKIDMLPCKFSVILEIVFLWNFSLSLSVFDPERFRLVQVNFIKDFSTSVGFSERIVSFHLLLFLFA